MLGLVTNGRHCEVSWTPVLLDCPRPTGASHLPRLLHYPHVYLDIGVHPLQRHRIHRSTGSPNRCPGLHLRCCIALSQCRPRSGPNLSRRSHEHQAARTSRCAAVAVAVAVAMAVAVEGLGTWHCLMSTPVRSIRPLARMDTCGDECTTDDKSTRACFKVSECVAFIVVFFILFFFLDCLFIYCT